MGPPPAAAKCPELPGYPSQRFRPDRRRQARSPARGRDRPDPDRGSAAEICHGCNRSPHRSRDLADPWPHGRCDARFLRAARNILAGAGGRPLAGGWCTGQSGAGVGGARAWRGNRHRRQPLKRRIAHATTIYSHSASVALQEIPPEVAPPKRGLGKFFSPERTVKREFFGGGGRPGISSVMVDAFNIMQDRITRARLAGDPPDLLISPRVGQIGGFDFHRADDLIAHGARAAERAIASIQEAIQILAPGPVSVSANTDAAVDKTP